MISAALTVLTLGGHAAGSGTLPDGLGLALVAGLAFSLTYAVSDQRRSLPWLLAYLLGGEALLHVVLTFTGGHLHGGTSLPATAMLAGHALAAVLAAFVLAYADDLLDRWLTLLSHVLGAPSPSPIAMDRRSAGVASYPWDRTGRRDVLLHHVVRRGPPRALIALTSS